jgi:hypothetical protein
MLEFAALRELVGFDQYDALLRPADEAARFEQINRARLR